MTADDMPEPFAFFRLVTSYQIPQAIYVAAKLGIADHLSDGPKTLDELSHATNANVATLHAAAEWDYSISRSKQHRSKLAHGKSSIIAHS